MKKSSLSMMIWLGCLSVGLNLTGCSLIKLHSNDDQYLKAKPGPVLKVPPSVGVIRLGNDLPITGSQYPVSSKPVSLIPPGSLAAGG